MIHLSKGRVSIPSDVLDQLLLVGEQMSNLCYNYGQPSWGPLKDYDRQTMAELARHWDAKRNHLRETQRESR